MPCSSDNVATGLRGADALGGCRALPPSGEVAARIPLRCTPQLAAVADAFVLLAGDGAGSYMTGAELAIDGGQRLAGPPPDRG